MKSMTGFALIFSLFSPHVFHRTSAQAAELDCALHSTVSITSVAPELGRVTGGGHVALTPTNAPIGRTGLYLVAGDEVVVLATVAARSCVVFTAPNRAARETVGWIATASLSRFEVTSRPAPDWVGEWHSGPEQRVTIAPAGRRFSVTGDATFGATDPVRAASGGVNTGSLEGFVTPAAGQADYEEGATTDDCHVRFWQLGPYLVAADNRNCGGLNVSFTGAYRRMIDKPK